MSNILNVVNFYGKISNGITNPVRIEADNGRIYIMKYLHASCSSKILYNELISYRLGKLIDVPMPDCQVGFLPDETIKKHEHLSSAGGRESSCFLSEYTPGEAKISPIIAKNVVNPKEIAIIMLFDQIILNNDRAQNDGNLLYDKKNNKLLAIDHSHVFLNGEIWTTSELEILQSRSPYIVPKILGSNYRVFSPHLRGHSCFHKAKEKIASLTEDEIEKIFTNIPSDWDIGDDDIKASKNLVLQQIKNIDGIIEQLQDIYSIKKGGRTA